MYFLLLLLLLITFSVIFTDNVSSIRFIFTLLVLVTYVLPSIFLWNLFKQQGLVTDRYKYEFILFVALSYIGFLVGYQISSLNNSPSSLAGIKKSLNINYRKLEVYSIFIGLIGLAGYGYFVLNSGLSMYLVGHGAGDFTVGGYIYELRFFIFSGLLLLYNIYLKGQISKRGRLFLWGFTALLVLDAYIQAQRGSWIRLGVIFMISFLMEQHGNTKITLAKLYSKYKTIFVGGVFLGLLLVFTVHMRRYTNTQMGAIEIISSTANDITGKPELLIGGSGIGEGNEFVTAYNAFYANERIKVYDYGKKWLYGFVNFVPRGLWKNKPTLFNFSTDEFSLISNYSLIRIPPGSVWTGIIDTYYRFAWYSPFFFVLIGFLLHRVYFTANVNLLYRLFYVCIYIGFFYFFTQEMFPLIIFTLYMFLPIFIATKASIISKRT